MRQEHARPELIARYQVFPSPIRPDTDAFMPLIVRRLSGHGPPGTVHIGLSHKNKYAQLSCFRYLRFAVPHAVRLLEANRLPFICSLNLRFVNGCLHWNQQSNYHAGKTPVVLKAASTVYVCRIPPTGAPRGIPRGTVQR